MERFFQLGFNNKSASAYVGMITANSFMKREFGTKLVEQYLPKVDITHVVDTSGASIPGHSTPTVIIFGRSRKPVGDEIRAVFGIQGEPGTPKDPAQGKVWRSILSLIDTEDEQDRFMSSHDIERVRFATHPWSVGGGGRFELKDRLNSEASQKLKNIASDVGYSVITGEDSFFLLDPDTPDRIGISEVKTLIEGDDVRDWLVAPQLVSFWPREESARKTMPVDALEPYLKFAWPFRTLLRHRKVFSVPVEKKGIRWWDLREVYDQRMQTPTCIAYAEIATHNHFSFRREGWLFKQTAPVIKLKDESSDNYLGVVGLLNSSVAGFWFHEVCHEKGGSGEAWQWRYVYNSTKVENFPLPTSRPLKLSKLIAELSERMTELLPQNFISLETTEDELSVAEQEFLAIRGKLIALQEELDWQVYRDYGLIEDELVCEEKTLPSLKSGERAFEIVMARDIKSGDLQTVWFEKNGGTQRSEMPQQWPDEYKELVSRRTSMIANDRVVRLLERPEYKRRWNQDSFSVQSANAIERLLLQLLENPDLWITEKGVQLKSAFEIASAIASNETFRRLASLYRGRADVDIEALVVGLVAKASVPHLESLVFSKTGLRKLRRWHETWSHQRNEDNEDSIAITAAPDKLTKADYSKGSYYDCRGKLSLPQERFIGFPYCERDGDGSLVLGWAGWDHIQRATAVVAYFDARKREGWAAERLVPLLASLDQLLPWIHQWHPEIDKEYNESAGDSFQTLLNSELQELGLTIEDVRNWTPPKKAKKKATKKKATKKKTAKKKSTKKKTAKS
jgi:hypothetical protein